MSRVLVGLTGGLASGKSTVARWLGEAGFQVIDADRVVAELYAPGGRGAAAVRDLFGSELLDPAGAVDRGQVAARIFSDARTRGRLEQAIHPLVRQRFAEISRDAEGVLVYEATLLVESGHAASFDLVISIEAPEARRLAWAVARGMARAQALARLAAQGDGARRRAGADRIIANDGTLSDLRRAVDELIEELRARLAACYAAQP